MTLNAPAGARGRALRIEYRRGKRWVPVATVKVPANLRVKRNVVLTRAQIGGARVKSLALRLVATKTARVKPVVGAPQTVRVPPAKR